jgi:hypothetical protein
MVDDIVSERAVRRQVIPVYIQSTRLKVHRKNGSRRDSQSVASLANSKRYASAPREQINDSNLVSGFIEAAERRA